MWPDADGSWDLGDSYNEAYTSGTAAADLSQFTQSVDDSGTGSGWGGWFSGVAGKVLDYTLARDAAKSQAQLQMQQAQALNPLLAQTASGGLAINPTLLIVGGGLLVALLVLRK